MFNKTLLAIAILNIGLSSAIAMPFARTQADIEALGGVINIDEGHQTSNREAIAPSENINYQKIDINAKYNLITLANNTMPDLDGIKMGQGTNIKVKDLNINYNVKVDNAQTTAAGSFGLLSGVSAYQTTTLTAENSIFTFETEDYYGVYGYNLSGDKKLSLGNSTIKIDHDHSANYVASTNNTYGYARGVWTSYGADAEFNNLNIDVTSNYGTAFGVTAASNSKISANKAIINLISKRSDGNTSDFYSSSAARATQGSSIKLGDESKLSVTDNHNKSFASPTITSRLEASELNNSNREESYISIGDSSTIASYNQAGMSLAAHAQLSQIDIGKNNSIISQSANGMAIGLSGYLESTINVGEGTKFNVKGGTGSINDNIAILNQLGGKVTLSGISVEDPSNIINNRGGVVTGNTGRYLINGSILNQDAADASVSNKNYQGIINLSLGQNSRFNGYVLTRDSAITNIYLYDTANWQLTETSNISELKIYDNAQLSIAKTGLSLTTKSLNNQGILNLRNGDASGINQFTINGDYHSNNGTLLMSASLNGNLNSQASHLTINGNSTGVTDVKMHNIGRLDGAMPDQGIEVIKVSGNSDGVFTLSEFTPISAGSYDYNLYRGEAAGTEKDWYLRARANRKTDYNYRTEIGSYIANIQASNTLFSQTLYDRLGSRDHDDNGWIRVVTGHNQFKESTGYLKTSADRYILQFGADVYQHHFNNGSSLNLGLMAGYAKQDSTTRSNQGVTKSEGKVDGYSVGSYATWYADANSNLETYVDSWILYNWFDNEVQRKGLDTEKYKSRGITASVETGHTFSLGRNQAVYIQPQAQLTYMGVHADKVTDSSNTRLESSKNKLQLRLGVRSYLDLNTAQGSHFKPYVEANWIHTNKAFDVKTQYADLNQQFKQQGARNIGEIKIGAEGTLNNTWQIWGNIGQQAGNNGYRDTQGEVGVKYFF